MANEIDPAALGALNGQPQQQQPKPQASQQQGGSFGPLGKGLQQWMMDAHAIGATGGDVVRSGLEAAYGSVTAMVNGVMQNNIEGAREARTRWKETAEGTLAFNGSRLGEYSKIWSGKEPMEEKLGLLNEIATGHYQDRLMAGLAQEQNITAIGRYLDVLGQQQQKAEQATKQLEALIAGIEARVPQSTNRMQ